jgi:hypothetical protein
MYTRGLLFAVCGAVGLLTSTRASAYYVTIGINYASSSGTLSGYARTYKEAWDPDYSYQCLWYAWDDVYGSGYYCALAQYDGFSVVSYADLYAPDSTLYYSGSTSDFRDATAAYSFVDPQPPGVWTGQGRHYEIDDVVLVPCNPLWGCGILPQGEYWYLLAQPALQTTVQCPVTVTQIIQEYQTYQVGFIPVCTDFSSGGQTAHFSWSQLNQLPGSGHPPWGIVRARLWNGLENTRTQYNRGELHITSGYRCPHGNALVAGSDPHSRHMWGDAVDMYSQNQTWNQSEWTLLRDAAVAAGATNFEAYAVDPTHLHVEWRQ